MTIYRHIKTGDLYRYHGDNRYTNVRTGVMGEIKSELAAKVFRIEANATLIFSEYPEVEKMVRKLGLKSESQ